MNNQDETDKWLYDDIISGIDHYKKTKKISDYCILVLAYLLALSFLFYMDLSGEKIIYYAILVFGAEYCIYINFFNHYYFNLEKDDITKMYNRLLEEKKENRHD